MSKPTANSPASKLPELLAPAGNWECAKAAVENGANAIYFGLERFNARMRAHNFTEADLPELMAFLHLRGVKGYVTFNTLVFEDELKEAEQFLRTIIAAGVDAAIVQDVGVTRLIRRLSPDFPIHASTQMTISSAAGVAFARELGCNLVVLARECSIDEIARINQAEREQQTRNEEPGTRNEKQLPLEIFVHGALCVAYSGQCLTSEALGGRSANRGECAQACRMPYELIVDGKERDLGDRRYLLSPQDLAGINALPDIVRAGIISLKIEGRLKAPEYVANITRVYRDALDRLTSDGGHAKPTFSVPKEDQYDLEMGFSRGLHTGWLRGIDNQSLAHARFAKKRGVFLGTIQRIDGQTVTFAPESPIKAGDGVVIDTGTGDDHEQGGRVFTIDHKRGLARLRFRDGQIDPRRAKPGDRLWKTSDPELERRVRQTYSGDKPRRSQPLRLEVHGRLGSALTVVARDETGRVADTESDMSLEAAENRPLNDEVLKNQLSRLGGTPFHLAALDNRLESDVILPISELNRIRRALIEKLEAIRQRPLRWELRDATEAAAPESKPRAAPPMAEPTLIALIRTLPQLEASLDCGVHTIYCDFENPKTTRKAVEIYRDRRPADAPEEAGIFVAPPRIFKTGEEGVLRSILASKADGYLIRNHEALRFFSGERMIGDFSLNVANSLTAGHFLNHCGLETITASYDLNVAQLEALLLAAEARHVEITIHQHMPMFHMEHCVFCAFMSDGKDYRDCGRPCEKHDVKLRDRVGMEHPLKADVGCRNTVFNSQAQTGAEYVSRFIKIGARRFRVEFLNDLPEQVRETLEKYQQLLAGKIDGDDLWRDLKLKNQLGVTRGQMAGAQ